MLFNANQPRTFTQHAARPLTTQPRHDLDSSKSSSIAPARNGPGQQPVSSLCQQAHHTCLHPCCPLPGHQALQVRRISKQQQQLLSQRRLPAAAEQQMQSAFVVACREVQQQGDSLEQQQYSRRNTDTPLSPEQLEEVCTIGGRGCPAGEPPCLQPWYQFAASNTLKALPPSIIRGAVPNAKVPCPNHWCPQVFNTQPGDISPRKAEMRADLGNGAGHSLSMAYGI